ncbi:hypothetical protein J1605_000670 [Eschrichtius robustus]|uniref:Uncharacterized protein n=1 Tax=Eschrichtius robustus TaxID=9764 RepID=A0AB34GN69_ESCRO|nr:hypothetical protein J1605_000670 [Eschrichtius robustus]
MLTCEHEKASDTGQEQRRRPPTLPSEHDAGPRSSAGEEEGADPPGMGSVTQVFRPRTAAASLLGQGSPGLGGQALLGRAAAGLGPGGEHQCARSTRPGPDSWRCHREAQVTQCWGWRRVGSRARAARPGRPVSFPSPLSAYTWGSIGRQRAAGAGQDGEFPWVQTPTLLCALGGALTWGTCGPHPNFLFLRKTVPEKALVVCGGGSLPRPGRGRVVLCPERCSRRGQAGVTGPVTGGVCRSPQLLPRREGKRLLQHARCWEAQLVGAPPPSAVSLQAPLPGHGPRPRLPAPQCLRLAVGRAPGPSPSPGLRGTRQTESRPDARVAPGPGGLRVVGHALLGQGRAAPQEASPESRGSRTPSKRADGGAEREPEMHPQHGVSVWGPAPSESGREWVSPPECTPSPDPGICLKPPLHLCSTFALFSSGVLERGSPRISPQDEKPLEGQPGLDLVQRPPWLTRPGWHLEGARRGGGRHGQLSVSPSGVAETDLETLADSARTEGSQGTSGQQRAHRAGQAAPEPGWRAGPPAPSGKPSLGVAGGLLCTAGLATRLAPRPGGLPGLRRREASAGGILGDPPASGRGGWEVWYQAAAGCSEGLCLPRPCWEVGWAEGRFQAAPALGLRKVGGFVGPVFAEAANLNSQLRSKSAGTRTMGSPPPPPPRPGRPALSLWAATLNLLPWVWGLKTVMLIWNSAPEDAS